MKRCVMLLALILAAMSTAQFTDAKPAQQGSCKQHRQELLDSIYIGPEEATSCGHGIQSTYKQTVTDQTFKLFRLDDSNRQKQIGTLETIDGQGFVYPPTKMTINEAESLYGKKGTDL